MAAADPSGKPMLQHALDYLSLGYPVFPVCSPRMGSHEHYSRELKRKVVCENPGKRPMEPWEPFQSRLPTATEVRKWWADYPLANIGMATGVRSGVVVLDCDSGAARIMAMEKGGLDRTPAVWTGKIGGVHYWLEHPVEEVRNFVAGRKRRFPGLDFRGDGGYVLLPPSVHASGNVYRWNDHTLGMRPAPIPAWLWELLREGDTPDGDTEYSSTLDVDEMLRGFDAGHRDDGLFRFACRLRYDDTPLSYAEVLVSTAARNCRPPFDEDLAVEKVRRAYKEYEPGLPSPTVEMTEDDWFSPSVAASPAEPAPEVSPDGFTKPISELLAMPDTDPDWMVDQLFTVASNGWVAAEPKVGKSWIVLELAYALATGMPFLGRFAVKQPRRILYVQEEDSLDRVKRRLKRLIKGDPTRLPPPDAYFRYSIRQGFKLDNLTWLETLRLEIIKYDAEVIILDVFNRLHGSDENKQAEMTAILNNLTRMTNDYGCAFIIVHHNRKPQQGNEARGNQRIRGSGVLGGWGECSLYLQRSKEKDTIIVTPESKDCPEMDDFTVALTDMDNGGIFLQRGEVPAQESMTKGDREVVDAVERITQRGIGATAKSIAVELDKDRSTIQARLKRLAQAGYLDGMPISDEPLATIIYTVKAQ
jgi:hypothetical protein